MSDHDYDIRDHVISGPCDICERVHVDVAYQQLNDQWVCVYCLHEEE